MEILNRKKKITSIILVMTLLMPILVMFASVISYNITAYSADTTSSTDESHSWIKSVLLVVLSFIVDNVFGDNKPNDTGQIGDQPLVTKQDQDKEVMGFYVNWLTEYGSSYDSLKSNWKNMDMVAPFWYTIKADGSVETRYGGHQYETVSLAKNRNVKVLPLINNNQTNNMILVDPDIRSKAINNIVELVSKYNYSGVNIDFEFIPSWTRNSYTAFIKELSKKLPDDKLLTISVFPKIDIPVSLQGAYDYAALAPYIDRMVIMSYDNHWSSGPAGPIAPVDWVEKNIKYALEYIPPEKIILGIANYGYDWTTSEVGQDIGTKKALELAQEKGVEIKWNNESQTPYFYYWDADGNKHEVWFENSHSAAFKLDLVKKYNLKGIAIWRLGNGTDKFWETIKKKLKS